MVIKAHNGNGNWFQINDFVLYLRNYEFRCVNRAASVTNGATSVIHMSGKSDFSTRDMRKLMHNGHKHKWKT